MFQKEILYDSNEAAQLKTVTGWVSSDGRFFGKDEHSARYSGCTHIKCECGGIVEKPYTACATCRRKKERERYNSLPYVQIDFTNGVCTIDGDDYFFCEDDLIEYMEENELLEIDLLICSPVNYRTIDCDIFADDAHEDWEPSQELLDKMEEFNNYLRSLPPHSYEPGKIRTNYKIVSEE